MRRTASLPASLLACLLAGHTLHSQPVAPPTPERVAFDAALDAEVRTRLTARADRVAGLSAAAHVQAYQQTVRRTLADSIGVLPTTDAPLAASVTRTTPQDGYRIEHVTFDSLPGLRVTGLLYVPDGPGPFPAVLGTAGHADEGKASPVYQHAWTSLARRGFVVLAYDPPGQGERLEYHDTARGGSRVGIGTREHMMTGLQVLLAGRTIGAYMVHDGRRALDYLRTRSEVDPARVAVAGNSGGGTQAALLAAVEPRLAAAVVSCYMTSWANLWRGPGPQDSEQILPGFLSGELDFADFAIAAAPRGFLVSSAIQDYFPIAGSRAASVELTRLYGLLGAADRVARVENDATHGWTQPLREGAYRALGLWLGRPGQPPAEAPVQPLSVDALQVTPTGQVATSGGSRTIRAINADEVETLRLARSPVSEASVAALIGTRPAGAPTVVRRSGDARSPEGETLMIEVDRGIRLEGWLRRAAEETAPAVLLVDEGGATRRGATIDGLVAAGTTVLALDVRGTGALGPRTGESGYSAAYQFAARAWLLGTSVVAWQARDILGGQQLLRAEAPKARSVTWRGGGQTGPAVLIAAQVTRPDAVVLEESIVSYRDVARSDVHDRVTLTIIPGVLKTTDLPELMARIAPVPVDLVRPRTPAGRTIAPAALETHLGVAPPSNVRVRW